MTTTIASPGTLSKLVGRQEVAERTTVFYFEKPTAWTFEPGQFLDLTLLNPSETDAEGNIRTFTIASAPHEDRLMVATRMRDTAFKRVLATMPIGTPVKIEGPSGDLTLPADVNRTVVFLAGGIGITPFRSMAVHAAKKKLAQKIVLFYSNRRPEDASFIDELQALEMENSNYRLVATMTKMEASDRTWSGEVGKIDAGMLTRYLKDAVSPIYYIAGPPEMVKGLRQIIGETGAKDDEIRTEEFSGY